MDGSIVEACERDGSLVHRHYGSTCSLSRPARLLEFGVPVGPWDLGFCVAEHVTRQLLVGSFKQPWVSQTAVKRPGQLEVSGAPSPSSANGHYESSPLSTTHHTGNEALLNGASRGRKGERKRKEGGERVYQCAHTLLVHLACPSAPKATPLGHSHKGNSARGKALRALKD